MTADIRAIAAADIAALLPLVEQYWIFAEIAGFDPARVMASARVSSRWTRCCAESRRGNANG